MEANTIGVTEELAAEATSRQLVLPDSLCDPADPHPTALSDTERWFEVLANKMAERKVKNRDTLYEMGRLLINAKVSLGSKWLKFLSDPRVVIHERDAQRMMRISRQPDGPRLAELGVSKATILLEKFRTPEDRQKFFDQHGDVAKIPERELRMTLKPLDKKKKKPAVIPPTTALESLPPELGHLREHVLDMPAAEAALIPGRCNFFGKDFRSLPEWGKFLVLGMFIATPAAVKSSKYEGALQAALDGVHCETAIEAALEELLKDARAWLLSGIDSQLSVVSWWDRGGPLYGMREVEWQEKARQNAVLDFQDAANEIARQNGTP